MTSTYQEFKGLNLYRNNTPRDLEFTSCYEVKWGIRVEDKEVSLCIIEQDHVNIAIDNTHGG